MEIVVNAFYSVYKSIDGHFSRLEQIAVGLAVFVFLWAWVIGSIIAIFWSNEGYVPAIYTMLAILCLGAVAALGAEHSFENRTVRTLIGVCSGYLFLETLYVVVTGMVEGRLHIQGFGFLLLPAVIMVAIIYYLEPVKNAIAEKSESFADEDGEGEPAQQSQNIVAEEIMAE